MSKLIYPIGIVALFLSTIEAGIKEDVETLLKNQFGEAAHLSMKKLILDRKTKSMVERKVHQHFFKDFIYLFDRERDSESRNTSRGSGRGRSRLPAEQGAQCRT